MITYSEKLKDPRWQRKRLEIMKRDEFTCRKCGDNETQLHVHHKQYINGNDPWEYDNKDLVTLCKDCHSIIEELRQENNDLNFDKIRILKRKFETGHKLIIYSCNGELTFETFRNDKKIIGLVFKETLSQLKSLINYSLKNG